MRQFLVASRHQIRRHDMTRQQLQEYFEAQVRFLGSRAGSFAFVSPLLSTGLRRSGCFASHLRSVRCGTLKRGVRPWSPDGEIDMALWT